ncbi:Serine/threonine-protein kinase pink-1, mitochondrial [Dirofilaria immitis]|nr:Serine/threonine-protein kinase pink-1, mitochondrial [Dirofilaria immitis]
MRKFRLPLRHLLKRSATIILRYGRPALRSEVLGRGLTNRVSMGKNYNTTLTLTGYQKNWRSNNLLGINRRHASLLMICSKFEISEGIKKLFLTNMRYNSILRSTEVPNRLEDYEIGNNIACGCDAAVYEARICTIEKTERLPSGICANLPFTSSSFFDSESNRLRKILLLLAYPYALKIMYNYDFDAPERHLWINMGTELVPLIENRQSSLYEFLPHSHPNIVQMYKAFTDCMPILEDARRLYPEALPMNDFCELIVDEPKTLFIVMRRQITCGTSVGSSSKYRMTLREYVLTCKEIIDDVPHLVLSDFGCALATGTWKVRYDKDTVYLGGNLALRAPEIRRAHPAPNNWVDFRMADLWASATIGYEIFTRTNPFYSRMRSDQYTECELPPLPKKMDYSVKAVIQNMLQIDPNKRPNPSIAANVLNISLFRFGHDLQKLFDDCGFDETLFGGNINDLKNAASKTLKALTSSLNDFMLLFAAETILAQNIHPNIISTAELQLRATFLSRIDHEYIWTALSYFCNGNNLSKIHPNVFTTQVGDSTFPPET